MRSIRNRAQIGEKCKNRGVKHQNTFGFFGHFWIFVDFGGTKLKLPFVFVWFVWNRTLLNKMAGRINFPLTGARGAPPYGA